MRAMQLRGRSRPSMLFEILARVDDVIRERIH